MVKFSLRVDKDKETEWLNEMAQKGYAMTDFFAGFYTFEKCEPGEYIYQIDLNEGMFRVNRDYREFMESMGIEIVALWGLWVVLRKKASEGEFTLYTDVESKIENYKKIRNMFKAVAIIELIAFMIEIYAAANGAGVGWIFALIIGIFFIAVMRMAIKTNNLITELRQGDAESAKRMKRYNAILLVGAPCILSIATALQDYINEGFLCGIRIIAIIAMIIGIIRVSIDFKNS